MANKQKRVYASNAILYATFVIGAIVVFNLLSTRVFGRVDLTEAHIYTLSQPSKDLVKQLPDTMTVKAFISKDLPEQGGVKTLARYVRDLIDEYRSSSNGKFRWEAIDPTTDKKLEEEASRCKVQKVQIQVLQQQKFAIGTHYIGLCFMYGDKVEAIPQVLAAEGLEYQISALIKQLTTKKRKVAFTTGHGEADVSQGFQALKQDLEQQFDVTTVALQTGEIAPEVDALVVGGPKQPIDEKGQRKIDEFVMQGKGVVFLVDGMAMQAPQGMGGQMQIKMGQANETGLAKILEAYGFKVGQDFVFDKQAAPGPIDVDGRQMLANAPMFVGVEMEKAKDLMVLEGIKGAVFPFSSSVELVGPLADGKTPAGAKLWKLASSSKDSWKHTGFFMVTPGMKFEETKDKGPFALGYAFMGKLNSAFLPPPASTADGPPANSGPSFSKKPVRLVVIGDSDFANDEYTRLGRFLPFYTAGAQLLYNSIAWTLEDEALTPLRAKTMQQRPLKVSSDAQASVIQWLNVLGLPLAFCFYGVVRWRIRRARRLGLKL